MPAGSDLRNALQYVRRFRNEIFIIALDGAVVAHDNFGNVLMDIAALQSLGIRVVLVHGIAHQLQAAAKELGVEISDIDGTGSVDMKTLKLARGCASRVSQEILDGLFATHQTRGAIPNAIKAKPAGVIGGKDRQYAGRVDRVDIEYLQMQLSHGAIPVISPVASDAGGLVYRLNSDEVAEQLGQALGAIKLLYLTCEAGLELNGEALRNISTEEMGKMLKTYRGSFSATILSKLEFSLQACQGRVRRAHIIDGRLDECIVDEVFSNEGIGTMIHANEYQNIRSATPSDVNFVWALVRPAMEKDELVRRSLQGIQESILDFFVFEIDGAILGCAALRRYDAHTGEIASLHVSPPHTNRAIGSRLVRFIEEKAREDGIKTVFCLSTQAYSFFQQKLGYIETDSASLPESRKASYEASGRNSKVLKKEL